jgi:hypothetical protein
MIELIENFESVVVRGVLILSHMLIRTTRNYCQGVDAIDYC